MNKKTGDGRRKSAGLEMNPSKRQKLGLTVIKGGRHKSRIILRCVMIAIIAAAALSVIFFGTLAPVSISDSVKTSIAKSSAKGEYPVVFDGSSAKSALSGGDMLYVLTESEVRCYSSSGGEIYSRLLGFSNAVIRTSKQHVLLFDRGSGGYRIDAAYDTLIRETLDRNIITGDIGDCGYYALATEDTANVAAVTVYNTAGKAIFRYNSSNYYVSDVAISDDGKHLAVVTLSSDNAKFLSRLLIFSTSDTTPLCTLDYPDSMIYRISFSDNKTLSVIGDSSFESVKINGSRNAYSFGSSDVEKFAFCPDGDTLLYLSSESGSSGKIVRLTKSADVATEISFASEVVSFCSDDSHIFVLSNKFYTYTAAGEKTAENAVDSGSVSTALSGSSPAVVYSTGIKLQ